MADPNPSHKVSPMKYFVQFLCSGLTGTALGVFPLDSVLSSRTIGVTAFDHLFAECLLKMKQAMDELRFSDMVSNLSVKGSLKVSTNIGRGNRINT